MRKPRLMTPGPAPVPEEVLLELGRLGIAYAQGFHIATPQPVTDFPYLR